MIPSEKKDNIILTEEEKMGIFTKKSEFMKNPKEWDRWFGNIRFIFNARHKYKFIYKNNDGYKIFCKCETTNIPYGYIDLVFIDLNHFNLLVKKISVIFQNSILLIIIHQILIKTHLKIK